MIKEIIFPINLSGRIAFHFVQEVQEKVSALLHLGNAIHRVNAKSLLGVLSLNIHSGDQVIVFYQNEEDMKTLEEIITNIKEEF